MPGEEYRSGYPERPPGGRGRGTPSPSWTTPSGKSPTRDGRPTEGTRTTTPLLDRLHEEYQEQRYLPDDQREDWMLSAERNAEYSRRSDETLEGVIQQHAQETWPGGERPGGIRPVPRTR